MAGKVRVRRRSRGRRGEVREYKESRGGLNDLINIFYQNHFLFNFFKAFAPTCDYGANAQNNVSNAFGIRSFPADLHGKNCAK